MAHTIIHLLAPFGTPYNHILQHRPRTQYGKETKKTKHYKQKNQEVSSFPTGEQNAARNRQDSMTDTHKTHKKKKKASTP